MHNTDSFYKELLNRNLKMVERQINLLERNTLTIEELSKNQRIEVESLKREYQKIQEEIRNYNKNGGMTNKSENLEALDRIYSQKSEDITSASEEIAQLQKTKDALRTKQARDVIDRKISKKMQKLEKLQKQELFIESYQQTMVLSKRKKEEKKNKLLAKQEATVDYQKEQIKDNAALQQMLEPENSVKDQVMSFVYDIKGRFYQKQYKHSIEVLQTMQRVNAPIGLKGANALMIQKKTTMAIRKNLELAKIKMNVATTNQVSAQTVVK